ncbi:TetR family transcriptional regulator [Streptomyces harbinensis]|uniref:TetR/AcrR family transcriptional regulator n=1 Tax=Streptomyces harbinensis TaxID=1176198 RepID=UPI00339835F7
MSGAEDGATPAASTSAAPDGSAAPGAPRAAGRRRGRPAGSGAERGPATRERILETARALFAERGYEKTSVRAIARGAEVDQALVHHYFGTKEGVFSAAVAVTAGPVAERITALGPLDPGRIGEEFTRAFLRVWEDPAIRTPLLAVVRSALTHETAARIFREFIAGQLLSRLAGALPAEDAELRTELAAAQLVGTVLLRYVLRIPPLATTDPDTLVRQLAPVVQHHLTGAPLPAG